MRFLLPALCIATLFLSSCAREYIPVDNSRPHKPVTGDNSTVTLAVGETVSVPGQDLTINFTQVGNDSRCPVDVQCVWLGNAEVFLTLSNAAHETLETMINSNPDIKPGSVTWNGYTISVAELLPLPHSGVVIEQKEYHVTLRVVKN